MFISLFFILFSFNLFIWVVFLLSKLSTSWSFLKVGLIWLVLLVVVLVGWMKTSYNLFISFISLLCLIYFTNYSPLTLFLIMEFSSFMILFYLLFYGYQSEKISLLGICSYLVVC